MCEVLDVSEKCLPGGQLENTTSQTESIWWHFEWNFFKCILQRYWMPGLVIHWNVSQLVSIKLKASKKDVERLDSVPNVLFFRSQKLIIFWLQSVVCSRDALRTHKFKWAICMMIITESPVPNLMGLKKRFFFFNFAPGISNGIWLVRERSLFTAGGQCKRKGFPETPTLFPKRNATFLKLPFFWGGVYASEIGAKCDIYNAPGTNFPWWTWPGVTDPGPGPGSP